MRSPSVLSSVLFASLSLLVARADVFPNFPAGDILKSGDVCRIGWGPDTNTTQVGAWKEMAIELMTGDNFNMVHITTVTTGQDGTVAGSFEWTCPEVIPNSAIYFYQFSSPHTGHLQWTTRFTIASATGETTDPENDTQPGGAEIAWGTGALKDPSTAVAAPVFTTSSGSSSGSPGTSSISSFATTPAISSSSSATKLVALTTPTQKTLAASTTGSSPNPSNSNAASSKLAMVDFHVMQVVVVLAASAMGFAILL